MILIITYEKITQILIRQRNGNDHRSDGRSRFFEHC